jgi:hypothetical protein
LVARAGLPLALLFILAACGGSTQSEPVSARVVSGPGFTVSVPTGWAVRKSGKSLVARKGNGLVSVTRFTLVKPYESSKFRAAAKELDGVAATLAERNGGKVTKRETTQVAGRKIRAYTIESNGTSIRIGFVLDDKTEYQLVCSGAARTACGLLFSTFALA